MKKMHLLRIKPDPLPPIHPVPEYRAGTARKAVYEDTKTVLQVPWMGVVTMSFSHYPQFWNTLWTGLRPLARSEEFAAACKRLRAVAEGGAREMHPTALTDELTELGYGARELADIKALIDVFSHGNMPYILIATVARILLEGHDLSPVREVRTARFRAAPNGPERLTLMEPHHADPATLRVYQDIRQTLGLPFVNTDYRALARWPSYFRLAWGGLKPLVGSVDHMASVELVHNEAVALIADLPNPGGLSAEVLARMAGLDAPLDEVRDVVRLFQWLLPELAVNVACLRAQLAE